MTFVRFAPIAFVSLLALLGCSDRSSSSKNSSAPPSPPKRVEERPSEGAETPAPAVAAIKEGWGDLKGRFVFDGSSASQARLTITKDQEYCGKHDILDESVVVNKENSGLANVVVYLYARRGGELPEPHESYAESSEAKVVLDNNKCRFEPHVCLLRTSQTLVIKNSDEVGHNTNITTANNPSFNQTIPIGAEFEHKLSAAERRPAPVACNIHPWMSGWLLPQDSPYFALSGKDGGFELINLPSGTWTFQVWHERAGSIGEVTIDGKTTNWSKGRFEVTINGDETTDFGEIKLAASLFEG